MEEYVNDIQNCLNKVKGYHEKGNLFLVRTL
jgi:hypothetical protein